MTPGQIRLIAGLSVLCTVVVLVGSGRGGGLPAGVRAALARQVVVPVDAPVAAAPVPTAAPAPLAAPQSEPAADPASGPEAAPATAAAHETAAATPTPTPAGSSAPKPSKAKHLFVIALTAGSTDAFAADSAATYLAGELRSKGTLLSGFAPLDQAELPNYIALTGGQPPNAATRAECATYTDFPADAAAGDDGVVPGDGCVYPNTVLTVADQVTASGRSWRAYAEGLDQGTQAADACRHPESGGPDPTLTAAPAAGETYATRHNPFVYFHSLLDLGDCIADDGPLGRLEDDLKKTSTTPEYAFIAPDLCDSGTLATCPDGRPAGLAGADAFLHAWVPRILESPAYRDDGALLVLFLARTLGTTTGPSGGLVVSRYAEAGGTLPGAYDPYSALRSIEDLLGLDPLGFAGQAKSFARKALPRAFAD